MSTQTAPLLASAKVTLLRGERRVLDSVSMSLHGGAWTAIVGPNGAGKSTLMAVLAGLLRPMSGTVYLAGRAIGDWPIQKRAQQLTWLGQTALSAADIAAHEIVRLGRLPQYGLLGIPTGADEAAVAAALDETEAASFAHRRLSELSAGERQRVLLARAFAAEAPILLLDEPTIHLDAPHQRRLLQSLIARARGGAAVITVLHDLTLALAADRLVVLADGKVQADGPPADRAVRETLRAVFDEAFTIERLGGEGTARWAAVPVLC